MAEQCPSVMVPFANSWPSTHHLMPVVLPRGIGRQSVIDGLRNDGVQTTIHYPPVHRMTFYREICPGFVLPRTDEFARRELTLPLHPRMTPATVELVVNSLAAALSSETSMEEVA
jgi:dTDP-4-amino-4,6-dideoxygalactose transaminase